MKSLNIIVFIVLMWGASACGVYSFTGRSTLDKDIKTFSVQSISLSAPAGSPTLSQDFTEKLKEYIQRNSNLKQVANNGDIQFEGAIIEYKTDGVSAAAGGDKASVNRLTIVVEIMFTNTRQESESLDKEFSFYLDYPQTQTLIEAEPTLVPKIVDQLILNIFNDTIAKW
jgi:hypothetical protein